MSTVTVPSSRARRPGRLALLALVPLVAAGAAVGFGVLRDDDTSSPGRTRAEVVDSLDPAARAYVLGVVNLSPAQLAAGFGNVASTGPTEPSPRLHAGRV
jgi:hypothetical protein